VWFEEEFVDAEARHLLNRFSYGITPALAHECTTHGGSHHWLEHQMRPHKIRDEFANGLAHWYKTRSYSPRELWQHVQHGHFTGWDVNADLARWTLLRRIYSRRQLLEVMTEFWSNLLHVPVPDEKAWPHRRGYDLMIRHHALGRFDKMLHAAITHPAMGCYLDNAESTRVNPNENLGRELLELHTVGRLAGYSEADVKQSAQILTGYRVDMWHTWKPYYSPADHHVGKVGILGFHSANRKHDGRPVTAAYLHYLAHHPLTARRIALRLATRFISDNPSPHVVGDIAKVFHHSGTDIKATLRALVKHREFKRSAGAKTRTPSEDLVATMRVAGVRAQKPSGKDSDFATAVLYQAEVMGQKPFNWPRPDGFPDAAQTWSSVSRVLGSWSVHYNIAGGWYPTTAVHYRTPKEWMPRLPARFDEVLDHVSRQILARPASDSLLQAACIATEIKRHERITHDHPLLVWKMPRLLHTVLDTPTHMTR
jgi:hypothetical protein